MRKPLALIALLAAVTVSAADRPKNVILLISDGTGPSHFTAVRYERGVDFRIGTMPVIGLQSTQAADHPVTDSAAAASAMATGEKTNNEALSVDADGKARETVLERAERAGKATGVVTTTDFFDATPAAFTSHAKERRDPSIPAQMLRSGAELIVGGGTYALGKGQLPTLNDLVNGSGFTLATSRAQLEAATNAPHVLGVFATQERDVDNPDAPLPVLARWAIAQLRSRGEAKGFFLMIEHEGPDSASHQNYSPDMVKSLKSFDEAVGVALDFAAGRNDTLVVVTGDHETGSLRISETRGGRRRYEFATTEHTAAAVPVFAYGPGSAAFGKFMENSDLGKLLLGLMQ